MNAATERRGSLPGTGRHGGKGTKAMVCRCIAAGAATFAILAGLPGAAVPARAAEPIRIGVIAEAGAIAGAAIPNGARIAADEINAAGGVDGRRIELIVYDDHSSAADAVRAFQRAVTDDKVVAVIGSYVSEVVLALGPWANRLHTPLLTPGAASNDIPLRVHDDYEANRFTFHAYLTSAALAQQACDAVKGLLVDGLHMRSAAIFSEDAAWTRPLDAGYRDCLPRAGLAVADEVRFAPDTTDFTPIFSRIEAARPDVMITGIAHVGTQPTVQWAHGQVPLPMFGVSAQATSSSFWTDTNGATDGVVFTAVADGAVPSTPKTVPFAQAYAGRFGVTPAYTGYTSADDVHVIADAIRRAGGTGDPDGLVRALEATDYQGTVGRVAFYGRDEPFTHSLRYGPGYVPGVTLQWQSGRQVAVWPRAVAQAGLVFPAFVRAVRAGGD